MSVVTIPALRNCMKKSKHSRPQVRALTAEEEAFKQSFLPKPPADLTEAAKLLFQAAINKVECTPTNSGALVFDYRNLTEEESFAIGVSVFPPKSVLKKEKDLWRTILPDPTGGGAVLFIQPTSEDFKEAIVRVRESARKEILVTAHGEKFSVSRRSGSISPIHRYLTGLYKQIEPTSFEVFWGAIKSQIGERKHTNTGSITLQEVDEGTLFYLHKGAERTIAKTTIRNNMKKYKAFSQ
jgi:hypothetical protein